MNLLNCFKNGIGVFIVAAGLCALTPSSSYGGLLGSTALGTLNVGLNPANFFDPAAVPGILPISATVANPNAEYTSNDAALLANFPGLTVHVSANLTDTLIGIIWSNNAVGGGVIIPDHVFTFGLFPAGQVVSGLTFITGNMATTAAFTGDSVTLSYDAFPLSGLDSASAVYSLSFTNVSVPEPGTYLLLGSMALIALFAARRKESASQA